MHKLHRPIRPSKFGPITVGPKRRLQKGLKSSRSAGRWRETRLTFQIRRVVQGNGAQARDEINLGKKAGEKRNPANQPSTGKRMGLISQFFDMGDCLAICLQLVKDSIVSTS
ncbi:hypothetical protein MPTK1_7g19510 [Marchantia polymorpha subsp. ruderalis]|uniref:Uncharacterized protein n=2 Tax=Marchantia polymorpha TaxID=3197 RepID=A0AAF6C1G7_MARPO|nr:hypothetical protein MARPO_0067s0026 [Marchantia polymorpha]BBN18101.1 hypothetical protein Mp_7g19510 [Marchantia polymorpha subsp. ruderalis]|eukprot:PTQ35932.1 hypothetical protein MARPO_0067s0026 [Marchantia polymorpha]